MHWKKQPEWWNEKQKLEISPSKKNILANTDRK